MNYKEKYLDYQKNIVEIDELYRVDKNAFHEKYGLIQDVMMRLEFPALYRSIATDLGIYLAECLRRRYVIKDVRWVLGHAGNKYQ